MKLRNRFARGLFVFISAALLVVSLTGWAASERYLSSITQVKVFDELGGGSGWSGQPLNVLVVGSDDRSGLSTKQKARLRTGMKTSVDTPTR